MLNGCHVLGRRVECLFEGASSIYCDTIPCRLVCLCQEFLWGIFSYVVFTIVDHLICT